MSVKELRFTDKSGFVLKGGKRIFPAFAHIAPGRV